MPIEVSLAMPVYNGERYVAEAIRSILNQSYKNFELIITDNASTDGTEQICREFAMSNRCVRYKRNERNLGAAPNHNLGFELSSGKYFKWCAHDDNLSTNFISACVSALERNQNAVLAYGATQSIDQDGHHIPLIGGARRSLEETSPVRRFQKVLVEKGTCFEIFGLFRREALQKSTLQRMYYGSDHALLAETAFFGTFVQVPEAILYNREHPARSINMDKKDRVLWQCTDARSNRSFEHISRLRHLIAISLHHRQMVSPVASLPVILRWVCRPEQLTRYTLESIGIISPSCQYWLRDTGWALLRKIRQFEFN
jgi:glycosyltransferase involved in cell wall biosynthesis